MIREVKYNKKNLEDRKIENNLQVARLEYFEDDFKDIKEAFPTFLSNAIGEIKFIDKNKKYFLDTFNNSMPTLFRMFNSELEARKALENKELLLNEVFCLVRSTLNDAFPEAKGNVRKVKSYLDSYDIYWTFSSDAEKQNELKRTMENLEYKPYIKK